MSKIKRSAFMVSAGLMTAITGGCLPNNFWADKMGEIVNGLLINGLDSVLVQNLGFGIV